MQIKIDHSLATQIVNTVKDVCGQDVNFIDQSGIIFASTNPERVGTFHEIGQKAAATGNTIEVSSDNSFYGSQKGINMPVYHNQSLLAVIGITGEPDTVRKYAHLAERITNLLIREQELNMISRNQNDKRQYIIDSLIRNQNLHMEYIQSLLTEFSVDVRTSKRLILLQINARYNMANFSLLEQKVTQMFSIFPLNLYAFHYPDEYLAVADYELFDRKSFILKQFAAEQQKLLKIAVGKSTSIYQLAESYSSAVTALKSITNPDKNFVMYDNLMLELLLSGSGKQEKEEFLSRTITNLTGEELKIITTYFDQDMSLHNTCEKLFLHKNTLQYKLNHIYRKTGLNPRRFKDAVLLYLAGKL